MALVKAMRGSELTVMPKAYSLMLQAFCNAHALQVSCNLVTVTKLHLPALAHHYLLCPTSVVHFFYVWKLHSTTGSVYN